VTLQEALAALEAATPAQALRASRWSYALLSAAHVAGIGLLFGAILPLDLRLLGAWRAVPVAMLARVLVPVAGAGLALAALTGAALFATRATEYAANPFFLAKLGLAGLGALNALALRAAPIWRAPSPAGPRVAAAALASLALWSAAIVAGRLIAFA
jgi:hypothetical protein